MKFAAAVSTEFLEKLSTLSEPEESDDAIEFRSYEDGRFGFAWIGPAGAVHFRVAMTREDAGELSRRFAYALELATKKGPKNVS